MPDRKLTPRAIWLIFGSWCLALTLVLYGSALRLPFFFDDFVHIPFVDENTLGQMWHSAGRLAYYRPLSFTLWKIMFLVLGRHSAFLQHAFNLLLHFLNGLLVGWLAAQYWTGRASREETPASIRGTWPRAFLAATLFLLFPFSYQAVPWVGSMSHLLVTALILLSLATCWRLRQTGGRAWAAASLLLAFLAPFAHENGVLVGPLLAALLICRPEFRQNARRNLLYIALWTLPALIWLPIWWLAPKGISGGVGLSGLEAILQNTTYFGQGIAYPLTWLGGRLLALTGANDMLIVRLLILLALAGAAAIQLLTRAGRRSLMPWLWLALALLPAVLFLDFDYVINGPRLLMLLSVGAAWLWADVALQAIRWFRGVARPLSGLRRLGPALIGVLVALVLVQNAAFIGRRMTFHHILGDAYKQAVAQVRQANDAGQTAIFVNLPAWLAPKRATYALGHEGVQFWPDYAPPDTLAGVNLGRMASLSLVSYEAIRPQMPYHYGLAGGPADWVALAGAGGRVYLAGYAPDAVGVRQVGDLAPAPEPTEPSALFESPDGTARVFLVAAQSRRAEDGLEVTLGWRVEAPPAEQVTVFVHVVDAGGQLVGQLDGDPLAGAFPFYRWPAGLHAVEWRTGQVEGDDLTVLVGLYDRLTQERFLASGPNGVSWPDNAYPTPVE
ncbi:MAG: hypothetical protein ACK2UH_17210 [Candidatus Promineifilaceae bacterium]|jgi:hypothetical protein